MHKHRSTKHIRVGINQRNRCIICFFIQQPSHQGLFTVACNAGVRMSLANSGTSLHACMECTHAWIAHSSEP